MCMTASAGPVIRFSSVASIELHGDFRGLHERYKTALTTEELSEVQVAMGPQGPWQSVDWRECVSPTGFGVEAYHVQAC